MKSFSLLPRAKRKSKGCSTVYQGQNETKRVANYPENMFFVKKCDCTCGYWCSRVYIQIHFDKLFGVCTEFLFSSNMAQQKYLSKFQKYLFKISCKAVILGVNYIQPKP